MKKTVYMKNISENGWWEDAYPSSYPTESAPGHKLQKTSKESGTFQSLVTINFVFFYYKAKSKGRAMAQCPPKYAPACEAARCGWSRSKLSLLQTHSSIALCVCILLLPKM